MNKSEVKSALLHEMVRKACANQNLAGMEVTVEKELLHYDIMAALSQAGLLQELVFQGGTCLRMAYGSQRLSEDLDFVGGIGFTPDAYQDLAQVLKDYFRPRYGLDVRIKLPKYRQFKATSVEVGRWMIAIETQPQAKEIAHQKIKLEVANVPSYSRKTRALRLNYSALQAGLSTVLVNCETEEEILADKVVALCLRHNIKARDLWDLIMLDQQGLRVNCDWVKAKFCDYKSEALPVERLQQRLNELPAYWQSGDFEKEMQRFLPPKKIQETLASAHFMPYFTEAIDLLLKQIMTDLSVSSNGAKKSDFQL